MILLSCLPSAFISDAGFIEDCIALVENIVADIREVPNGILISRDEVGISVSYQAYKYALGFNTRITNKDQIARMESAIDYNIKSLQPLIANYEAICTEMNKNTHWDGENVRKEFLQKVESGALSPMHSFDEYFESVMAPLQQAYDSARNQIYKGACHEHPNKYLQSLGLKFIRFEQISPLYRD